MECKICHPIGRKRSYTKIKTRRFRQSNRHGAKNPKTKNKLVIQEREWEKMKQRKTGHSETHKQPTKGAKGDKEGPEYMVRF